MTQKRALAKGSVWRGSVIGLPVAVSLFMGSCVGAQEIVVSAAASLTDALQKIGKAYEVKSRNKITFNFGASSGLARQIEEGAPVDIFFSADLEKMEELEKKGQIKIGSRKNLLSNQLVIAIPLDSRLTIRSPKDLLGPRVKRIALAEPSSVPAGIYARKYLESEGLWEKLKNKVIPVLDVRAALASVESGDVDVAFLYKTDAAISRRARIVYEIPEGKGPKIIYPVALVQKSKEKNAAGDFLKFLSGDAAKRVFQEYGFVALE